MNISNISKPIESVVASVIDPILSNIFLTINLLFLSEIIGLFGIVGNILNIIIFKRQGYRDGLNVTLTALAISDLGALVTQQISNNFADPWFRETELIILKTHLFTLMIYTHGYFIRISGFITAFAAFERCLRVSEPIKTKNYITPLTAGVVNTFFFLICIFYFTPLVLVVYIDWTFLPNQNKSILSMFFRDNRESVYGVYYFIADMFVPYGTILLLLAFTLNIARTLQAQSRWRRNIASNVPRPANFISGKQKKVVVMLTSVSVIFIICLTPHCALHTVLGVVRELKLGGTYAGVYYICYSFTALLETINCSVTVFVYYKMSSRYRQELYMLMPNLDIKSHFHFERKTCSKTKSQR